MHLKFRNIQLLPVTSFGSLARELAGDEGLLGSARGKSRKSLVLFGLNGIDEHGDHDCGHTSGHLMIAIVAEYFRIPVKVIADSFKVGKIEWGLALKRETPWLTGQRRLLSEIKRQNIALPNYLDDRIPSELIDEIIADDDLVAKLR